MTVLKDAEDPKNPFLPTLLMHGFSMHDQKPDLRRSCALGELDILTTASPGRNRMPKQWSHAKSEFHVRTLT